MSDVAVRILRETAHPDRGPGELVEEGAPEMGLVKFQVDTGRAFFR